MCSLNLARDEYRFLDSCDAPILITNPTSRHRLRLTLRVTQNPAIDRCAAILVSIRMCLLWTYLKLKKEHRHIKARDVG